MSTSLIVSFAPIGWQRLRLAKALFTHNSIFRHAIFEVAKVADPQLPKPLVTVLYSEDDEATIQRPVYSLLVVFAVEYALYQLVAFDSPCEPSVVGHSIGEFVAAVAAGVLSLQAVVALVIARGEAMEALPEGGGMVSLKAPASSAAAAIASAGCSSVTVAAVNGPQTCVLSGKEDELARVLHALPGAKSTRVRTSVADHGPMMAPVANALEQAASRLYSEAPPAPPRCMWASTVTGCAMTAVEASRPDYWAAHAVKPVDLPGALTTILEADEASGACYLLEMGEGMLNNFTADHVAESGSKRRVVAQALLPKEADGGEQHAALEAEARKEDCLRAVRAERLASFLMA